MDHCESRQLIADVERLLEERKAFQNHMAERVAMLRQKCWENVDLLRDLLNERRVFWHRANASSLRFALSGNRFYNRFRRLLRGEITFAQIVRKLFGTFKGGA